MDMDEGYDRPTMQATGPSPAPLAAGHWGSMCTRTCGWPRRA
jgi:hypothetical protein